MPIHCHFRQHLSETFTSFHSTIQRHIRSLLLFNCASIQPPTQPASYPLKVHCRSITHGLIAWSIHDVIHWVILTCCGTSLSKVQTSRARHFQCLSNIFLHILTKLWSTLSCVPNQIVRATIQLQWVSCCISWALFVAVLHCLRSGYQEQGMYSTQAISFFIFPTDSNVNT